MAAPAHAGAPVGSPGVPPVSAANSVAAFLARWEQSTKLSDAQYGRITTLSKLTSERAIPKDFARMEDQPSPSPGMPGLLEGIGKIDNIQQFYEWFASLEQEIAEEREEKFTTYLEKLCDYRSSCDVMLAEVDRALTFLSDLEKSYAIMSTKTGELHQACESLLLEQKRLAHLTDLIKEKLAFYNDMEKIARHFNSNFLRVSTMGAHEIAGSTTVPVTDPAFRGTLKRLDECIAFVQNNPTAKDQSSHLLKFRQLQNRGLYFLRGYIMQTLMGLTQQVQAKIKTAPPGEPSEGGVLYLQFRTAAPQVKSLCVELEKRASLPEYQALLTDCHNCYFNQRRQLLLPIISSSLRKLAASPDLHATVRAGCAYVINVSCLEFQLYNAFFEKHSNALRDFLGGVAVDLYDTLRPLVIHSHQLDVLCLLVSVIRNQILDDQLEKRGGAIVPFSSVIGRLLEDAQERIIFLAQTYIRDEIATFMPAPDDLAYPDKLQRSQQDTAGAAAEGESLRVIYATWYPTLQKTIICLSRLSLSLDANTFSGIAQEAVSVCISTLLTASRGIGQQKSVLHGALFLVRHFLILRKELTPFDVEFKIIEKTLDFSHMTGAISRLLSGRTPLAALYSVVQAAPRVLDNAVDSKKELDRALLGATEALISLVIKASMEGMVSFATKASAVKITPVDPTALRKLAFAHPEAINTLAQETRAGINSKLPGLLQLVQLYLIKQGGTELVVANMKANMIKYIQQAHELLLAGGYTTEELLAATFDIEAFKVQVQSHFANQTWA